MSKAKTSKKDTLKKESEPVKVKKTDCMNVVLADLSDVQLLREISENLNNVVPTICEHVKDMDDENKYNTYNKYFNVVRYYKETLDKINRDILQLLHNKHIEETHKCDKDAANMVDNEDNVSVDADEPPPKAISKKAPAKRAASAPPVKSKVVAKKVASDNESEDSSDDEPVEKPVAKPVAKPATKPVAKPAAKPAKKPAAKEESSSDSSDDEQPVKAAPVKKPAAKSTKKVAPNPEPSDDEPEQEPVKKVAPKKTTKK